MWKKIEKLSIEEKAKAYDRALAKAKEEAIDGYLDAVAINDIFPELKDRVIPQPKQEWSEEDKKALKVVTDIFCQYGVHLLNYPAFIHWLKTLPNRIAFNHYWKPSEEEMKALADALSLAKNCGEENAFDLRTLYEQLKKLREE